MTNLRPRNISRAPSKWASLINVTLLASLGAYATFGKPVVPTFSERTKKQTAIAGDATAKAIFAAHDFLLEVKLCGTMCTPNAHIDTVDYKKGSYKGSAKWNRFVAADKPYFVETEVTGEKKAGEPRMRLDVGMNVRVLFEGEPSLAQTPKAYDIAQRFIENFAKVSSESAAAILKNCEKEGVYSQKISDNRTYICAVDYPQDKVFMPSRPAYRMHLGYVKQKKLD